MNLIETILEEFRKEFITQHYDTTHPHELNGQNPQFFNGDPLGYFDENFVKPSDVESFLRASLQTLREKTLEEVIEAIQKSFDETSSEDWKSWEVSSHVGMIGDALKSPSPKP